jgi:putative transposase
VLYGDDGGLNRARRLDGEQIRTQVPDPLAHGVSAVEVAIQLEVSRGGVPVTAGMDRRGLQASASKGVPRPKPTLSDYQLARLEEQLRQGPRAVCHEWNQPLDRGPARAPIATMFHMRMGITTIWQAMRHLRVRHGKGCDQRELARVAPGPHQSDAKLSELMTCSRADWAASGIILDGYAALL